MLDLRNPYHELRSNTARQIYERPIVKRMTMPLPLRSPQLWVQGWHLGTQNPMERTRTEYLRVLKKVTVRRTRAPASEENVSLLSYNEKNDEARVKVDDTD